MRLGKLVTICNGILLALMITGTVGQNDICSSMTSNSDNLTVPIMGNSDWNEGACHCTVRTNSPFAEPVYVHLGLSLSVAEEWEQDGESQSMCGPMFVVSFTEVSGQQRRPLTENFASCAKHHSAGETTWMANGRVRNTVSLYPGQELDLLVYNPSKDNTVQGALWVAGDQLSVDCGKIRSDIVEFDVCPCGVWVATGASGEFDAERRLMIGLIVAFVGLAIVVAVIVGVYFYKKRQSKNEGVAAKKAVTVENRGYEGSKQNVNGQDKNATTPPRDANVNYAPDPTLNLQLQSGAMPPPMYNGSHDSGVASGNEPDKRLPFMQGHGPSASSLDNLTRMPDNYPPLAGGGSLASLDRVEPTYVTRQDAMPPHAAPRPVPRQGSHASLDNPDRYYGNVDDVYAAVRKPAARSASHDEINAAATLDARQPSGEDLNASRLTIETDV